VPSLARPGGNITGLGSIVGLQRKQLELLKEAVPSVSRVGIVWSTDAGRGALDLEREAEALGVGVQVLEVRTADHLLGAFDQAYKGGVDGLLAVQYNVTLAHPARIADLALSHGMASMFPRRLWVAAGGLMAYGDDIAAQFRRAAYYVDRILRGAAPADLPVEQPREFDLVINLRTAQALSLTIPRHVLLQATEVIQ
jgi:putative tryptophan/tyrosine transport system substrate-binding protein